MDTIPTGMLREGHCPQDSPCTPRSSTTDPFSVDGIHIDMDHLKKGEVKCVLFLYKNPAC